MRYRGAAVLLLIPSAVVIGAGLLVWDHTHVRPIYTLAQVQAGLYRTPRMWVGRTVRVRAQIDALDGYGASATSASPSRRSRYFNLLNPPSGSHAEIILGPATSTPADPSVTYPAVNLVIGLHMTNTLLSSLQQLPVISNIAAIPDFEDTPQNIGSPRIFVLYLQPRGQAFDATLLNVE